VAEFKRRPFVPPILDQHVEDLGVDGAPQIDHPDPIDFRNEAPLGKWRDGGRLAWNTDFRPLLQQETPVGIRVAGIAGTHQQGPLRFSSVAAQNDPITFIRPPPASRYNFRAASLSRFVMENIRRAA
jgi:hypothetical protein